MGALSPPALRRSSSSKPVPIRWKPRFWRSPARQSGTRAPRPRTRYVRSPACGGDERMTVVFVLWLREVKKYLRSRVQIVASLGGPLMYLGVLGFGLGPVFQRAGDRIDHQGDAGVPDGDELSRDAAFLSLWRDLPPRGTPPGPRGVHAHGSANLWRRRGAGSADRKDTLWDPARYRGAAERGCLLRGSRGVAVLTNRGLNGSLSCVVAAAREECGIPDSRHRLY